MKAKDADLYLYILDTYDCLLSGIEGTIPVDRDVCEKLRSHIMEALTFRYEELKERIPGKYLCLFCFNRDHKLTLLQDD